MISRGLATAGTLAATLLAAASAGAHVPDRAARAAHAEQVPVFFQQPIALPVQQRQEPPLTAIPRAECEPGGIPEGPLQGRVAREDVDAGRVDKGYRCNLEVVGHHGRTGGFRVHRYVDKNGHECAYYDTTLLFPTNVLNMSMQPTGVAVLDMTDPRNPVRTDSLLTPAMQTPHESVNISIERGLLAAVMGNPTFHPGIVDVYDISQDCRRPVLMASAPASIFGHESGMAPDGLTFYPTSIGTGHTTAVDLTNPRVPVPIWQGNYDSHGMTTSDDGNRGYLAAGSGLIILDLSEVQARKPNPQVREISRLVWSNMTIPQVAIPVTIKGRPYLVEIDEYAQDEDGSLTANGPVVGAARIIDISDETKPFVVSNIRLAVHQPEHRAAIADDYGARFSAQGYAGHYCNVPQRREPGILACSMILSGLRVFDIRDPEKPREIAYHVAPPSTVSETGGPTIDERANYAMSQPAFAPERGEIWYTDGTSGFHALRMNPKIWPFPTTAGAAGCVDNAGFESVGARASRGGVQLRFARRAQLPVRIDVFRVSEGKRVVRERLIARFDRLTRSLRWNGVSNRGARRRAGAGYYFVRFTMLKDGKAYDTRRVVLRRGSDGRFAARPEHYRRDSCGLLGKFKLERPVFGGPRRAPLVASYRLTAPARVTITVSRGARVVKRFATATRAAGRTHRISLGAAGLPRGDYTVRLLAAGGEDQVQARLVARRL